MNISTISPREAAALVRRDADNRAHIVGLSGGKDSTAMALRLVQANPDVPYTFFCTPTGDELPPLLDHWNLLAEVLAPAPFLFVQTEKNGLPLTLAGLIDEFEALPNWRQRWCTRLLKIVPGEAFMRFVLLGGPVRSYIGLRADEETRAGLYAPDLDQCHPLREWGWGINEVRGYLAELGVCIPRRTDCASCFFQTIPEWKVLLEEHPEAYAIAADAEQRIGHTFRSNGRDTWPAGLKELAEEFRAGRKVRGEMQYREGQKCRACAL